MADITMCKGEDCPMRDDCRRFRAKPDEHWQSWFAESPNGGGHSCSEFIENVSSAEEK